MKKTFNVTNFLKHLLSRCCLALAVIILMASVLLTLIHAATPLLSNYNRQITAWISQLIHRPLSIESISFGWRGIEPVIKIQNAKLYNQTLEQHWNAEDPHLRINTFEIGFNVWQTLWRHQLQVGLIAMDGTTLSVKENQDGSYSVYNDINQQPIFILDSQHKQSSLLLSELSSLQKIYLNNIKITWIPNHGDAFSVYPLTMEMVNQGNSHHQLWGMMKLSRNHQLSTLGFIANVGDKSFDLNHLNAQIYLHAKDIDVAQWNALDESHPHLFESGNLNGQMWVLINKGKLQSLQTDVLLQHARINNPNNHKIINIDQLKGHFFGEKLEDSSWSMSGSPVTLAVLGHAWPTFSFYYSNKIFYSDTLPLQCITLLNQAIDNDPKLEQEIAGLKPSGSFRQLLVHYQDKNNFYASAKLENVGFHQSNVTPSLNHLTGDIYVYPDSGVIHLQSQDVSLKDSRAFSKIILFNQLDSAINWAKTEKGWEINIPNFSAANADINLEGKANLQLQRGKSPYLNLLMSSQHINMANVKNYLPYPILNKHKKLGLWLHDAFLGGEISHTNLVIRGPVAKMPFDHQEGIFMVNSQFNHAMLQFDDEWPELSNLNGEIIFRGRQMDISANSGIIFGNTLTKVTATIADLGAKIPDLQIQGVVKGQLDKALQFVQHSPLQHDVGRHLSGLDLRGPLNLELHLDVPLEHTKGNVKSVGIINTAHTTLNLPTWGIQLDNVTGKIRFQDHTVAATGLHARYLQEPLLFNVNTVSGTHVQSKVKIDFAGAMPVATLENNFHLNLLNKVTGKSAFNGVLELHDQQTGVPNRFTLNSDLKGVTILLPVPLAKSINEKRPTQVEAQFKGKEITNITVNYNKALKTQIKWFNKRWLADFSGSDIIGEIRLPNSTNPVFYGRFVKLYLAPDENQKNSKELNSTQFPPMDLAINDFHYNNVRFGRAELVTSKISHGLAIDKLNLNGDTLNLNAKGVWKKGTNSQTTLRGNLTVSNVAKLLQQLNYPDVIYANNLRAMFQLSWPGNLQNFSFKNLNGSLGMSASKGRFVDVGAKANQELAFGQLFTLLSLQSLPRRLLLDFSDLTNKGFSFDSVSGHFNLQNGVAKTKDIRIKGVVADVNLQGLINTKQKSINLYLDIMPHVTASIPLIATIAGGPIVGAVTWVANTIISPEVSRIASKSYFVSGNWSNPRIVPLQYNKTITTDKKNNKTYA